MQPHPEVRPGGPRRATCRGSAVRAAGRGRGPSRRGASHRAGGASPAICRATGLLDASKLPLPLSKSSVSGRLCRTAASLEHDHADGVGNDVVQLACDGGASAPATRAVASRSSSARRRELSTGRLGARTPVANGRTGQPGERERHRDEEQVGLRVVRVVVDHDRRAGWRRAADPRPTTPSTSPQRDDTAVGTPVAPAVRREGLTAGGTGKRPPVRRRESGGARAAAVR